jgi:hypothetical protein
MSTRKRSFENPTIIWNVDYQKRPDLARRLTKALTAYAEKMAADEQASSASRRGMGDAANDQE